MRANELVTTAREMESETGGGGWLGGASDLHLQRGKNPQGDSRVLRPAQSPQKRPSLALSAPAAVRVKSWL